MERANSDATITPQRAATLMATYETTIHALEADMADIATTVAAGVDHTGAEAYKKGSTAKVTLVLFSAVCVFLIAILSLVMSVSILKPLSNARSVSGVIEEMSANMSSVVAAGDQGSKKNGAYSIRR